MESIKAIPEKPLSTTGRVLYLINVLLLVALVILPIVYYVILPETVPIHWSGEKVTSYGSKINAIALLLVVMPLANLIILLIVSYRWRLVKNYPYLINLPGFALVIGSDKISPEEKTDYLNKIFEVVLVAGFLVGVYLLFIEYGILEAMRTGSPPGYSFTLIAFGFIPIIVAVPLYLYRRVYMDIRRRLSF